MNEFYMRRILYGLVLITLVSCNTDIPVIELKGPEGYKCFEDDFEQVLDSFWGKELADMARQEIVTDPLNKENQVLKIDLKLDDFSNGGKRSELRMSPVDSFNYKTNYSFKFLLPESFFQKEEPKGWYIIHQWHDEASPGFNWKTHAKTQPPVHLLIEHSPNGDYYLIFKTGIKIGSLDEIFAQKWNEKLRPNHWYSFSCEVLWSLYNSEGYASPKLDGDYFINWIDPKDSTAVNRINRRNMYNIIPNYFKFGLYRSGTQKYDRTIYFDDFKLESYRVK